MGPHASSGRITPAFHRKSRDLSNGGTPRFQNRQRKGKTEEKQNKSGSLGLVSFIIFPLETAAWAEPLQITFFHSKGRSSQAAGPRL